MRGEDAQEICAVVDTKSSSMAGCGTWSARKSTRTLTSSRCSATKDLPPKRKPQFVANPDLLIEIPKPIEEEKGGF